MAARKTLKRVGVQRGGRIALFEASHANPLQFDRIDQISTEEERSVYNEALADFLTGVLREWIISNPGKSVDNANLATILPEALDEFMWKHLDDT
jgi:hypothetical protein